MLALPSFLITLAFTFLYGTAGAVNAAIAGITGAASPALNFLYTPAGVIAAEITFFTPFVVRPLLASFALLPRAQLDVAASLGASPLRVLRSVVMPEAWPALMAGGSLVLLLTLNEFGIVLFTGAKGVITLPVLIYTRGIVTFDLPGAAVIATVQVALSLALYCCLPVDLRPTDDRPRKGGRRCCCGTREVGRRFSSVFALVVLVVFVAPLATVVVAGLAGSWTGSLPSNLGFGHFERRADRREPGQPVGQPADRVHRGRRSRWCSARGRRLRRARRRSG